MCHAVCMLCIMLSLCVCVWQGAGWLNGTKKGGAGKVLSTKSQLRNEFEVPAGQTVRP